MAEKRQLSLKHTFTNSVGTLVSRVSGILKWTVVNQIFGARTDPFIASFKLINNLRNIVAEGMVSNAFIPVYKAMQSGKQNEDSQNFANNIVNIFILGTILLTILGMILAPYYFPLLVPGFEQGSEKMMQGITLTVIMMPFTVLISLFAMAMGILNSHERFTTPAFAPLLFNLCFILFPLFLSQSLGIYSLGLGVVVGGGVMFLFELLELFKTGYRYKFYINLRSPALKEFLRIFAPTAVNMGILMLTSLVLTIFLSHLSDGSLTIQQNGFIINMAPIGIFGVAIGTVILPLLSGFHGASEKEKFTTAVSEGFHLLAFLILPVTAFFIFFPDMVSNTLYRDLMLIFGKGLGEFSDSIRTGTYMATALYAGFLFPKAANVIFTKIFYSTHDAKTPLWGAILFFALSFGGYGVFRFLDVRTAFQFGLQGVIITDIVAAWALSLFYFLRMRKLLSLRAFLKTIFPGYLKTFFCTIISTIATFFFYKRFYLSAGGGFSALAASASAFMIFVGIYFITSKVVKLGLHPAEEK